VNVNCWGCIACRAFGRALFLSAVVGWNVNSPEYEAEVTTKKTKHNVYVWYSISQRFHFNPHLFLFAFLKKLASYKSLYSIICLNILQLLTRLTVLDLWKRCWGIPSQGGVGVAVVRLCQLKLRISATLMIWKPLMNSVRLLYWKNCSLRSMMTIICCSGYFTFFLALLKLIIC